VPTKDAIQVFVQKPSVHGTGAGIAAGNHRQVAARRAYFAGSDFGFQSFNAVGPARLVAMYAPQNKQMVSRLSRGKGYNFQCRFYLHTLLLAHK
jgi:hypothetical protein